jgi:hypothetical protein
MATRDKSSEKQASGRGRRAGGQPAPYSSIATHPRARASVRRAKAWTGLIAFLLAAALALKASVPVYQTGLRALAAGIAGYLLAWWFSMLIWRHLILAEQRVAVEQLERRRAERAQSQEA